MPASEIYKTYAIPTHLIIIIFIELVSTISHKNIRHQVKIVDKKKNLKMKEGISHFL